MKKGKWRQCMSVLRTRSGGVFCIRGSGHNGDHRGDRAQWNENGRVPITLKPDGTPKSA